MEKEGKWKKKKRAFLQCMEKKSKVYVFHYRFYIYIYTHIYIYLFNIYFFVIFNLFIITTTYIHTKKKR